MNIFLTVSETNDLLLQHKLERDKCVGDRIKVILLTDEEWHLELIARALFIDDSTVRRHLNSYRNENRLTPDHKGSEAILIPKNHNPYRNTSRKPTISRFRTFKSMSVIHTIRI